MPGRFVARFRPDQYGQPRLRPSSSLAHRVRIALASSVALACCWLPGTATAHPHVFVEVRADLVFGPDGKVAAVRHHWSFDEAYSAFSVQGLDTNGDGRTTPDELTELAATNLSSLADFGYFTVLKANGVKQPFAAPRGESMSFENGRLTLHFEMPLKSATAGRLVGLEVYDPTFFVDFQTASAGDAVTLKGAPPGCALTVSRPKTPPAAAPGQELSETFFQGLTASSGFGAQFASRAIVACP